MNNDSRVAVSHLVLSRVKAHTQARPKHWLLARPATQFGEEKYSVKPNTGDVSAVVYFVLVKSLIIFQPTYLRLNTDGTSRFLDGSQNLIEPHRSGVSGSGSNAR